ncbi:MAG: hypothetical protein MH825_09875 [Cyanobacteria bacterium]|nr:hypothetical protein [Cyanobacteriota bacterium]
MSNSRNAVLEITGKAANSYYSFLSPALIGTTTLQVRKGRVVERTRKIIATRNCEILLSEIDSVEIIEDGISWLLVLGIFTVFLYGLGIIFWILYFFLKYQYLIIHSGGNAQVLCISGAGGMERAKTFMEEVLRRSEQTRQG